MPERTLSLEFPRAGLVKKYAHARQSPFGTPSAKNIWLPEFGSGRERGGVRPPLGSAIATIGAPYNSCEATWINSGLKRGAAITTANGTYLVYYSSGSWTATEFITTNPGTTFASCAVYLQTLYQAAGGSETRAQDMTGAAGAGSALTSIDTAGTAPTNCGLVTSHGDRLVLAGDTSNPYIFYMPRINTPTDWDYAQTDPSAAVTNGSGGTGRGKIGEPVTALISHTRDCLIFGCTDSMYVARGNLAAGGALSPLKAPIGPLMQSAWCHIGNGSLLFMTRQGLFAMAPGCGDEPVIVSQNQIPSDLKGIDPGAGDWCSLGYCSRWDAVDIIVNKASGTDLYYRYFLSDGGSFWPMDFGGTTMQLAVNFKYQSISTVSPLALLSSAGAIHQYDTAGSETIDSHLVYGPFPLGSPGKEAAITEISGTLSDGSGAATPTVYVADSAQEASAAAVLGSSPSHTVGNWAAGLNGVDNPCTYGASGCVRFDDVSGAAWSAETIELTVNGDGVRKRG